MQIEAIINCDERGQIMLPKEIRKRLNINPGDKLALLNCTPEEGKLCLAIIKVDSLEELVKDYLTPVLKEIIK